MTQADLPAMFAATDKLSRDGQRETATRTAINLTLLVFAAVGGALDWKLRGGSLNVGGLIAVVAFSGALVVGLSTASRKPEEKWYTGRAAAESVKTLAWRYAVAGDPFLKSTTDVDRTYARRLSELVSELRGLDWGQVDNLDQITPMMRLIRAASLTDRRKAYVSGRIDDQSTWYTTKAKINNRRGSTWAIVATSATTLGIGLGIARMVGALDADYLSILAAIAASANAWAQMRQHKTLATSYALAAQELGLVKATVSRIRSEEEWARVVADAEDAISREHTLWLARRSLAGGSRA